MGGVVATPRFHPIQPYAGGATQFGHMRKPHLAEATVGTKNQGLDADALVPVGGQVFFRVVKLESWARSNGQLT